VRAARASARERRLALVAGGFEFRAAENFKSTRDRSADPLDTTADLC